MPLQGFSGYFTAPALGRVYTVHPNNRELFHLRLLLHHVRGPTSFADLRLIDVLDANANVVGKRQCATFMEACGELGLIEDDRHWSETMREASLCRSSAQLRDLFAILLGMCGLASPITLWNQYKESMTGDLLHRARLINSAANVEMLFNETLILLEDKLEAINGNKLADYGLPAPTRGRATMSKEVLRELSYDVAEQSEFVKINVPKLTPDQSKAFVAIRGMIERGVGGVVFMEAPGGTGKTFVLNLLLASVRAMGEMALSVASSGIAATLLAGGRTAHSALKLPLDLARAEDATCAIKKGIGQACVLRQCQLIVWDEASMSHRFAFHALDKSLRDIRDNDSLMGGAVVVLSGDFRQTLPIVPRGTPADEFFACLKNSYIWPQVVKFQLTTNMRAHVQGDTSAGQFAQRLLQVGDGRVSEDASTGQVTLPFGTSTTSVRELIDSVYPNLQVKNDISLVLALDCFLIESFLSSTVELPRSHLALRASHYGGQKRRGRGAQLYHPAIHSGRRAHLHVVRQRPARC